MYKKGKDYQKKKHHKNRKKILFFPFSPFNLLTSGSYFLPSLRFFFFVFGIFKAAYTQPD